MDSYQNRKEVPDIYKWDLTEIVKDEDTFNNDLKVLLKSVKKLKSYKGCLKNSNKLLEFLSAEDEISSRCEELYVYAFLKNDEVLGVAKSLENLNKAYNLINELEQNTAFFTPEILKLTKEEYDSLFNDKKMEKYRILLDHIFRNKDHSLNENEEQIVTNLVNSMNKYEDISSNLINSEHNYGTVVVDGKKEVIATNNVRKLLKSKEESTRKKVYTNFNKKLDEYSGTCAGLLNGYVQMEESLAKIYKFKSSWESHLFHYNLDNKVIESLKKSVINNLDTLQKFYNLKRNVLGFNELHAYDLNLEMGVSSKKYSIEDAQNLLLEALKPLGEDYIKHFKKIFDNHYIDYCQYKGKTSGAYSCSTSRCNSRILMSYNYDLSSVSTIAHEGGHNVHHQYVKDNNETIYRNITTLVAEVASLTNECLLSSYLVKNSKDKNEKLAGIENIMDVIVSNLYGAVREAKMEQDMYNLVNKGGMLTKDYLDSLSKKSLKKYYGSAVKTNKNIKNGWVTRSHYYMNYYLYNYAICISVATNVASKIENGDKNMLDNYIKFLSTGSDVWPVEAFKILGIDIENEDVYNSAIKYFDNLINTYEKIYNDKEV